ncbi:MAG: hypothetical protein HKO59_02885 [Phycisphaerales bacterium]|nr:hypothetical protein [Phycisphaerae bacterium]NNF43610.1 hypothetical protein [Phycisphaerales bacterium]NNM24927.1 hypothetical protein [Phycisphaerales bacterium]
MDTELTVNGTWQSETPDDPGTWELTARSDTTGRQWLVRSRTLGEAVAMVAHLVGIELTPNEAERLATRILAGG